MIWDLFLIILITIIAFIPISLWGYFFGYIDNNNFNKKRFFLGILAWWISVFPVLYLWDIIDSFSLDVLNIFQSVYDFSLLEVFLSFLSLFLIFSIIPFFFFYSPPYSIKKFEIFIKRFLLFFLYFIIISLWFYLVNFLFNKFNLFSWDIDFTVSFWNIVFNSLKLIVFYYFIIWIIEEVSKFLFFSYDKNFLISKPKDWVIYAIFIALWFAFVENILYFQSLYENYWFWKELISTYFLRNIFSVFLHILCSWIFAYYFSIIYLKFREDYNLEFIKTLFIWFFLSFFFHAIFDIMLSFNMMFFVFLYIIWWYFYLTYIFYKD